MPLPTQPGSERRASFAWSGPGTVAVGVWVIAAVLLLGRFVVAQEPTKVTVDGQWGAADAAVDGGPAPGVADASHPSVGLDGSGVPLGPLPSALVGAPAVHGGADGGSGEGVRDEPRSAPAEPSAHRQPTPTHHVIPTVPTSAVSLVPAVDVARERAAFAPATSLPHYGVNTDLGFSGLLPDAGILVAVRPTKWLRLQSGAGYNGIAFGVRGGSTLVNPFLLPVSLTCEGGHYFAGDANKIVRWFDSDTREITSLRRFSYDYFNLLGGLDFAGTHLSFYVRGGVTWMRTTVRDFARSVREVGQIDLQASDPRVTYRGPTLKLGAYYFF